MFFPEHPGFPCNTNRLWRPCLYCARVLVVVDRKPYFRGPILFCSDEILGAQRRVRVLDSKSRGLRVRTSPASLPCVLEQGPLTNPCLVLGQPRKTCPDITEIIMIWDVKIQIKQIVPWRGAPLVTGGKYNDVNMHVSWKRMFTTKQPMVLKMFFFFHKRDTSSHVHLAYSLSAISFMEL